MQLIPILDTHQLTIDRKTVRSWFRRIVLVLFFLQFAVAAGSVYGTLLWLGDTAREVQIALITTQEAAAKLRQVDKQQSQVSKEIEQWVESGRVQKR